MSNGVLADNAPQSVSSTNFLVANWKRMNPDIPPLMRELKEELQIMTVIRPDDYMMTVEHAYPECHITMHVYRCTIQSPDITLTEHIACRWLPAEQLDTLDWASADILIVRKLMEQDC